jgi:hypothetical protein
MKQVRKGETIARTAKVEGLKVWFQHLTLHKPSGAHYALRTGFDFANVPQEAILRLAGETLLIRWRTAFKNAEKIDDSADNQLNNVVKMLSGRKPRMTKTERAERLFEDMSAAERIALLQKLQAQIGETEERELEEIEEEEETEDEEE